MFEIATEEQLADIVEEIFHEGHIHVLKKYIEMQIQKEFSLIESAMSFPTGSKERLQAEIAVHRISGVKDFLRLIESVQSEEED